MNKTIKHWRRFVGLLCSSITIIMLAAFFPNTAAVIICAAVIGGFLWLLWTISAPR